MATKNPNRKQKRPDDGNGDAVDAEQRRRDKKRVQNRLSQQCCREKQLSYIKQLERFVEDIQSSGAGLEGPQVQLRCLQKKHLALMKENRELREALLRMRKKLLSISSTASSYAENLASNTSSASDGQAEDDEIISSHDSSFRSPKGDVHTGLAQDVVDWEIPPMPLDSYSVITPNFTADELYSINPDYATTQIATETASAPVSMPLGNVVPTPFTTPSTTDNELVGPLVERPTLLTTMVVDVPPLPQPMRISDSIPTGDFRSLYTDLIATQIPNAGPFGAPYYPMPTRDATAACTPDYQLPDTLVGAIERTAREVVEKMRFAIFNNVLAEVGALPRPFSTKQVKEIDHMTLLDICKTSLRLLLKCTILEGTALLTEKILRWRIQPTPKNCAAIPEPFRPTTLQQVSTHRPPYLDFIHFGDLRDQLIIYMGAYDVRAVQSDSVQTLVREVPNLGIALPIVEFYHGLVEKTDTRGVVEIDGDSQVDSMEYDPHAPYQQCRSDIINLARMYGLHRLSERRLSPAFAKKYPYLDVRNITTKYPIVSWRDISRYEHLLLQGSGKDA